MYEIGIRQRNIMKTKSHKLMAVIIAFVFLIGTVISVPMIVSDSFSSGYGQTYSGQSGQNSGTDSAYDLYQPVFPGGFAPGIPGALGEAWEGAIATASQEMSMEDNVQQDQETLDKLNACIESGRDYFSRGK